MTTRSRTSGSFTGVAQPYTVRNYFANSNVCAAGQTFAWQSYPNGTTVDYVGEKKWMTDTVVPNFRKLSSEGKIFMNFMSSTKKTLNAGTLSGMLDYRQNYWQCGSSSPYRYQYEVERGPWVFGNQLNSGLTPDSLGNWTLPSLYSGGEMDNLINEASTKCHNKRGRPSFDFWETLAERRESYRLLASYGKSAASAARALEVRATSLPRGRLINGTFYPFRPRKGKKRGITATPVAVTRAGLEAMLITEFGFKPLVSAISDVVAGMSKNTGFVRQTVRESATDARYQTTRSDFTFDNSFAYSVNALLTHDLTVRAMSLDEWYASALENVGLSAKGLITLPWELITCSFIVDSFVNIGDFLGASLPTPGVNQLGACLVTIDTRSLTNTLSGATPVGIGSVNLFPSGSKTGTIVTKTRFPGLRAPTLVLRQDFGIDPELEKDRQRAINYLAVAALRLNSAKKAIAQLFL